MTSTLVLSVEVQGHPESTVHESAVRFVSAWLAAGNDVNRVFFYHEAVSVCTASYAGRAADWSRLSRKHGFELTVCIGAAERRGVGENGPAQHRVRPPFEVVGLGQLIDAIACSDRFVTFA